MKLKQRLPEQLTTLPATNYYRNFRTGSAPPYLVMAIVLVALSLMIWFSSLPEIETSGEEETEDSLSKGKTSVLQFPHLLLGALCLFLYVGVEVMAGDVIGQYGRSMGMSLDETKIFTSYTLLSMVVGYITRDPPYDPQAILPSKIPR